MVECCLDWMCAGHVQETTATVSSWLKQSYHPQKTCLTLILSDLWFLNLSAFSSEIVCDWALGRGCDADDQLWLSTPQSLILCFDQLWVSTLTNIRRAKKLLWWGPRATWICETEIFILPNCFRYVSVCRVCLWWQRGGSPWNWSYSWSGNCLVWMPATEPESSATVCSLSHRASFPAEYLLVKWVVLALFIPLWTVSNWHVPWRIHLYFKMVRDGHSLL